MLCFSKFWFFRFFDRLNLLLDRLKLWLKIWFESAWLNRCSIVAGSIECNFRSIESIFRSIEIRLESFLKHEIFTCSSLFQKFQKAILSLFDWSRFKDKIFVIFPQSFSRFLLSSTSKTLLPFPFWFNLIFYAFKGKFRTYGIFGFLVFSMISFKIDQWVFIVGWY